jgi:hypothetical protein
MKHPNLWIKGKFKHISINSFVAPKYKSGTSMIVKEEKQVLSAQDIS